MQVYFWGTRGSLPSSMTADAVERKILAALRQAQGRHFANDEELRAFAARELPFAVRGSYGCNTSCVEVREGADRLILDAGSGLRDFGMHMMTAARAKGEPPCRDFSLCMSHLHWDHVHGFPFFVPAYVPGNRVTIYGCHPDLRGAFESQQDPVHFPVPLSGMRADIVFTVLEPGRTHAIAGFEVYPFKQNHPGDSYGYRIRRNGRTVVYSTDSEHTVEAEREDYPFLDVIRDADLLIFDAQYHLLDAIDSKANWGHSSNLVGVELAVRAGVKRLCLFHNEHTCDDEALDRFLGDTRKYLKLYAKSSELAVDLAYDGLELAV